MKIQTSEDHGERVCGKYASHFVKPHTKKDMSKTTIVTQKPQFRIKRRKTIATKKSQLSKDSWFFLVRTDLLYTKVVKKTIATVDKSTIKFKVFELESASRK